MTLIESPDVGPIGVGEGTWPTMRDTLRRIGVTRDATSSASAMPRSSRARASTAGATAATDDYYFHPFVLPQGYTETNLVAGWLQRHADVPFADLVSFQPHLCAQRQGAEAGGDARVRGGGELRLSPRRRQVRSVPAQALHRAAGRAATCSITWSASNSHDNGDIAALQTEVARAAGGRPVRRLHGHAIAAAGPALSRCRSCRRSTCCSTTRRWRCRCPTPTTNSPIASQTISHRAEQRLDLGHRPADAARHRPRLLERAHVRRRRPRRELRSYVERTGGPAGSMRHCRASSRSSRATAQQFWHRNCVAIGLSAGFIEPLEASALALVELSAAMLSDEMPATREAMDIVARRFNDSFTYRWERVIDFLKLHYVLSRAQRQPPSGATTVAPATFPDRLRELLALWRHQPPSRYDFHRVEEVFPVGQLPVRAVRHGLSPRAGRRDAPRATTAIAPTAFFREAARADWQDAGCAAVQSRADRAHQAARAAETAEHKDRMSNPFC